MYTINNWQSHDIKYTKIIMAEITYVLSICQISESVTSQPCSLQEPSVPQTMIKLGRFPHREFPMIHRDVHVEICKKKKKREREIWVEPIH